MRRLHWRLAAVLVVVVTPLMVLAVPATTGHACCDPDDIVISVNGTICWESTGPQPPARATGAGPIDSVAAVTVTLSRPTTVPVTVIFNTVDGTAVAPYDYEAIVNREVTIPAGQRGVRVPVKIKKDNIREPDEWFMVTIAEPSSGRIGKGHDRVIIRGEVQPGHGM